MADVAISTFASKTTPIDADRLLGTDSEAANATKNFRVDNLRTSILGSDLAAIRALAPADDAFIQRKSGVWVARTMAQLKVDLVLVKADVGLGSVDNTSDAAKPISSATQTALDAKQGVDSDLTAIAALSPTNDDIVQRKAGAWTNRSMAQLKTDLALVKGDVGLGNVDNTSDATKNSAVATLTNKTLTTPTIGSFANATHDHSNAAGGNKIPFTSITEGFSLTGNGGKAVAVNSGGTALEAVDSATLRSTTDNLSITPNGAYIDVAVNEIYYGGTDPSLHGLLGWVLPPFSGITAASLTNGVIYTYKLKAPKDWTISRFFHHIDTGATSLTSGQNWMGLYDSSGNRLQQTADMSANWAGTGVKQSDLAASQLITKGSYFYIAMLHNASTPMQCRRAALNTLANLGISGGANILYGTYGTGQTTLPSTITPASIVTTNAFPFPIGFS